MVNPTAQASPLAPLWLGYDEGAIRGDEWDVTFLESGTRVAAWKDREERALPGGLSCQVVGTRLTRKGKERFWKETFEIYYDGVHLGSCSARQLECVVGISP